MKHLHYFYIIVVTLFVYACGDASAKMKANNKQEVANFQLLDIFDPLKVKTYLNFGGQKDAEARELYLKAMDAYVNKNLLDSAVIYMEQSILVKPSPESYYELSNILRKRNEFDKGLQALAISEMLNYEPLSNLLLQRAKLLALTEQNKEALDHITFAIQAGAANLDIFNSAEEFLKLKEATSEYEINNAISAGMKGISNPKEILFAQFKKRFLPLDGTQTINTETTNEKLEAFGYINYEYDVFVPEMRALKFSREPGVAVYYAFNLGEVNGFHVLTFIENNYYLGDSAPCNFIVGTYDKTGKIIDRKRIGNSLDEIAFSHQIKIKSSQSISVTPFKLTYKDDVVENGYYDNEIVSREQQEAINYRVDANGKILVDQVKMAQR